MKKTVHIMALALVVAVAGLFLLPHEGRSQQRPGQQVKVAVTAAFVSARGMDIYKDVLDYMSKKLGQPVTLVSGLSYQKVNELLRLGTVQEAFVCGYAYTREKKKCDLELLCAPVMKDPQYQGKPVYYSYVIVPKDSKAKSFKDLRGKKYALSDPLSNSGHNMPRYKLAQMGTTKEKFFSVCDFTGAHEKSIELVARKVYDGASIDSLVWDYDNKYHPESTSKTKVIEKHGPAGIPPVVVPRRIDPKLKKSLQSILVNMHKDPQGRRILDKALMSKFVVVDDSNYDSIRQMESFALKFLSKKK